MKRVLRYPLRDAADKGDGVSRFAVSMPAQAVLLHAGRSRGELCVWALVDDQLETEPRSIVVVGTGREVYSYFKYVQTVQVDEMVWHVFDGGPA
jgi:hypothetical protein